MLFAPNNLIRVQLLLGLRSPRLPVDMLHMGIFRESKSTRVRKADLFSHRRRHQAQNNVVFKNDFGRPQLIASVFRSIDACDPHATRKTMWRAYPEKQYPYTCFPVLPSPVTSIKILFSTAYCMNAYCFVCSGSPVCG